ncbi:MAG: ABC transporter permease [Clostridium sp.]|nr:ABC transporter permease [Clostridium sp.]
MSTLKILIKRNIKLFFKDKGMFFTSLITPVILLVLYATFLKNVYYDSFVSNLPEGMQISDKLINGFVGGQLISSILAVSCVTVAFCSNMLMVQDKANGSIKDLTIAPLKRSVLAMSYYAATMVSTLLICFTAAAVCLAYVAGVGWYMDVSDVICLLLDVLILVMFGTALSSIINFFLNTQGQMSAVGTIVSSGYGFICGAYMPISQFSDGLQRVISFLPGTYGTSLIRNHAMRGVYEEMTDCGIPDKIIEVIKDSVDCNIYFLDNKVEIGTMYIILICTVAVLIAAYIFMNMVKNKKTS